MAAHCAVECQLDIRFPYGDMAQQPARGTSCDAIRRHVSIHKCASSDHRVIPDANALGNNRVASDIATVADAHRCAFVFSCAARDRPPDGIVSVNLNPRADAAVAADLKSSAAVK